MPSSDSFELEVYISILEQQRNNALTELARAAARIAALERAQTTAPVNPEEKQE
jgi:uncharacterized protein YbjQ (UPF0145 family)